MTNKLTLHDFNLDFEPEKEYAAGLDRAKNRDELVRHVGYYRIVADDAFRVAWKLDDEDDWRFWREGLAKERRGEFAGEAWAERFCAITMPEVMFTTTITAQQFGVPWSVAFKRLVDLGELVRSTNNVYRRKKDDAV